MSLLQRFPILELLQDCEDPPCTPASLEELEIELGFRFPEDYRQFLLRFNGGHFRDSVVFDLPNPVEFVTGGVINDVLGNPGDRRNNHGVTWYAETYEGRLPTNFLAIAHCNGGDLVLLKPLDGSTLLQTVWFWDGVAECEAEGSGENIHFLANSFSEFLSLLRLDVCQHEDEYETVPIFQAIERGNLNTVRQYLLDGGDIETRNAEGLTLLAAAARHAWPSIISLLLARGANPNWRDNAGRTALHYAAENSVDCVRLLLHAGADVKARDAKGKSVIGNWYYRADQILRAQGAEE